MFALVVAAALSLPSDPSCHDVRAVRAGLVARGLDDRSVAVLEGQVCGVSSSPPALSEPVVPAPVAAAPECGDLQVLAALGYAEGTNDFDGVMNVACSLGQPLASTTYWPGGQLQRNGAHTWYWPNGKLAQNGSTTRYWSNGSLAQNGSSTWYFPSGRLAQNGPATFYTPSGRMLDRTGFLTLACGTDPRFCRRLSAWPADVQQAWLVALAAKSGG